ncbi:hypothetical protein [Corallococcus sp. Z5C101001]|uniref:hypothetical protein n=1 Tax=Corallococcus sp. Z5C101001 TaxID=2596829 RepID=UPI0011815238|nr:hypothetical protein [Corallococcus sp. Z5C101001]TSC23347.1 hypothetical protein FOF48_30055 [Corallococcus sp. Z5C101001]
MTTGPRAWLLGLALMLNACAVVPPALPSKDSASLRYNIAYTRQPQPALDVEIVLLPSSPSDFLFRQPERVDTVWAWREDGSSDALRLRDGAVHVPPGTRFLRYHYPLAPSRGGGWSFFFGMGDQDSWHVAGKAYLLRPRTVTPRLRVDLTVSGTSALLPWRADDGGVYHLRGEDLVDSGFHGFGGRRCEARVGASVLEVALLGSFTHLSDADLCAWLQQAAREVGTIRKAFPHPRITVRVVPVPGEDSPALFGMVQWSSPPSISILVGQDATAASFAGDWVALHEMLHLAHPTLLPRVAWLTEGLATYYTEVARARSGRQTAEQAWKELTSGFARGRSAARSRTMAEVVAREGEWQGIYWTGAFFALHLDVELRRVTHGRARLEDVLELLATRGPTSSLGSFGAAVDTVAGQPLFDALLARHLTTPAFSELDALLDNLGVRIDPGGVKLHAAPGSRLREAMDGERSPDDGG